MKYINHLLLLVVAVVYFSSCEKDNLTSGSFGSLKIINTVTGGEAVRLGGVVTQTANNNNGNYSLPVGNPDIYVWPISDSTKPYYSNSKGTSVSTGDYFSLFLTGTTVTNEGILVKESWQNYTDSVAGVRFVNLSPNSTPVNVTLSTSTSINQFSSVAYKQLTDFVKFPAGSANTTYTFQVRAAAAPNTVIASITMSGSTVNSYVPRFKNVTLVFKGNIGGTGVNAPVIVRVNYY